MRYIVAVIVVLFWHAVALAGGFYIVETSRALDAANIPMNAAANIAFIVVILAPGFLVFAGGLIMSRVYIRNMD